MPNMSQHVRAVIASHSESRTLAFVSASVFVCEIVRVSLEFTHVSLSTAPRALEVDS